MVLSHFQYYLMDLLIRDQILFYWQFNIMDNKILIFVMVIIFLLYTYSMMGCTSCSTQNKSSKSQQINKHGASETFTNQQPNFDNIYEIGHYMN